MEIHVGQTSLQKGGFQKYAEQLSFIELLAEPVRLPKLSQLKELHSQAPEDFVFSVVLSERSLLEDQQGANLRAYGLKVARALSASWLVLRTPPSIRPSTLSEQKVETWVRGLEAEGFQVAWEPRGVWDSRRAAALAERLGVQLVQDISDVRPSSCLYVRIAGLGTAQRVGEALVEKLALKLEGAERLYLAVASPGAVKVRAMLEELFDPYDEEDDALEDLSEDELAELVAGVADEDPELDEEDG